ncbi:MAG: stage II sporulation protein M, partial [Bacilli bacterium]
TSKVWRALGVHWQTHLPLYIFIAVLFFVGILCGALFTNSMSSVERETLEHYLNGFYGLLREDKLIVESSLFRESFLDDVKLLLIIWVLGMSMIGVVGVSGIVFLKGVALGFSVGLLVKQFGLQGMFLAIGSIIPQNILLLPLLFAASVMSLRFAGVLIKKLVQKQAGNIDFWSEMGSYTAGFALTILLALIPSLAETFLSPYVMELVASFTLRN